MKKLFTSQYSLLEKDIHVNTRAHTSSELLTKTGVKTGAASCYSEVLDETRACCDTKLNGKVKVSKYASDDPFDTTPAEWYCHHSDEGTGDWN